MKWWEPRMYEEMASSLINTPMSEPKITKFVVKKQQESNTIEIHKDQDMHCEVCDVKGSFWIGGNCTLCLPCIKGLAKIAKELK